MNRSVLIAFLVCTLAIAVWSLPARAASAEMEADGAFMDLSPWNPKENGAISLNGEWELYWNELLSPQDIAEGRAGVPFAVEVPSTWGSNRLPDGNPLPDQGVATYRLTFELAEEEPPPMLALYASGVASAFRVWVNGVPIGGAGVVGPSEQLMSPDENPQVLSFRPEPGRNELLVQVSNFVQRKGGIWDEIRLGDASQMTASRTAKFGAEAFSAGILVIMGIFHLGLFAVSRSERSSLYFGIVCLAIAVRTVVLGEHVASVAFPWLAWEWSVKAEYISVSVALFMMILFVRNEYATRARSVTAGIFFAALILFTAFVLLTPAKIYTLFMLHFQLGIVLPVFFYCLAFFVIGTYKRKATFPINLAGFILFSIAVVLDILFYNQIIPKGQFAPYGLLAFLLTQSINMWLRFSRTAIEAEQLSAQLQSANESLERKIAERTAELSESNLRLESANEKLSGMEKFRRQLLSNISHELGTPITSIKGYASAMMEGVVTDDYLKYAKKIHDRTRMLELMIDDLTELTKLETDQIQFAFRPTDTGVFFKQLFYKYESEITASGRHFEWVEPDGANIDGWSAEAELDPMRIEQVVSNLLSNAVKYTSPGGRIRMAIEYRAVGKEWGAAVVSVADNGEGIDETETEKIFERFYRTNRHRQMAQGTGLGLAVCREIMIRHKGWIAAESKPGTGSRFRFGVPVRWVRAGTDSPKEEGA